MLELYGYIALFPLAVLEGPIITVIAGFLVSLGVMNPFIVYGIIVLGDVLGDGFWYLVGRHGGNWQLVKRIEDWFGVHEDGVEAARKNFLSHRYKMMMASKLAWGLGSAGLVAAGRVGVPYLTFATTCLVVTMTQAAFFLGLGYFFGEAYEQIAVYLDHVAAAGFALGAMGIIFGVWYVYKNRANKGK